MRYPYDDNQYDDEQENEYTSGQSEYGQADPAAFHPAEEENPFQNARQPEGSSPPQQKKKGGSFKMVCLILVVAILAGAGGGAIVYGIMADSQSEASGSPSVTNAIATPIPSGSTGVMASGFALTAAEIYSLGCEQVVGITTEVTLTNIFGQASSSAVSGSGFIISSDGYILTNYHVVSAAVTGGYEITVMLHDGTEYTAEFIGYDDDTTDVAVIKIDAAELNAATIGDSDSISVGETVYTVGNPLGELTYSITSGIISALDREIALGDGMDGGSTTVNMFQTDAAVNSGNSGGPAYNAQGKVIGVVTAKSSDAGVEGIGFAIPINGAVAIAEELIQYGYVTGKPSLGIEGRSLSSTEASYYNLMEGVYVTGVTENGAAEKAGIQTGDVITELDGKSIMSFNELKSAINSFSAGDSSSLTVYRNGEYEQLNVTFDEQARESIAVPG